MFVKDLIEELQKYDPYAIVAINYNIYDDIIVKPATWIHNNYPYDKPDVAFISLE